MMDVFYFRLGNATQTNLIISFRKYHFTSQMLTRCLTLGEVEVWDFLTLDVIASKFPPSPELTLLILNLETNF